MEKHIMKHKAKFPRRLPPEATLGFSGVRNRDLESTIADLESLGMQIVNVEADNGDYTGHPPGPYWLVDYRRRGKKEKVSAASISGISPSALQLIRNARRVNCVQRNQPPLACITEVVQPKSGSQDQKVDAPDPVLNTGGGQLMLFDTNLLTPSQT